jgi:LmbE family N-acetylglucosaminyl deacetylase
MILAPHPDDEVLAAGGVILSALKSSSRSSIRVIVATNGDASYSTSFLHGSHIPSRKNFRRQSTLRQKESLNALASLGLASSHVHFWGFPDRGLAALWKSRWDHKSSYQSRTTRFDNSTQAVNSPVMPYTKASVEKLFENELLDFHPTVIIMPHPYDNHSDHSALAGFTLLAVKRYTESHHISPTLLTYWMWHQDKPWWTGARPHDLASFHLEIDSARQPDLHLTLSPEIQTQKLRALQCYPSQKIAAGKIFRKVSRSLDESFTPL